MEIEKVNYTSIAYTLPDGNIPGNSVVWRSELNPNPLLGLVEMKDERSINGDYIANEHGE